MADVHWENSALLGSPRCRSHLVGTPNALNMPMVPHPKVSQHSLVEKLPFITPITDYVEVSNTVVCVVVPTFEHG